MKNVHILGINITVSLLVSLYLLLLTYLDYTNETHKLPDFIAALMNNFIVRLLLMALIAATALGYNKLGGLHVAVLMAAAYLLTMSMVHKDQITENFIEKLTSKQNLREHLSNDDNGDGTAAKAADETQTADSAPDGSDALKAVASCANNTKNCGSDKVNEQCANLATAVSAVNEAAVNDSFEATCKDTSGTAAKAAADTQPADTTETFDNPTGKAYTEKFGGSTKCGPYAGLDEAFNPQAYRPDESVLASGAPDQLPKDGANFSSTPSGPFATSGVAYQFGQS